MLFLLKIKEIFNHSLINIKLKSNNFNTLYLLGNYGIIKKNLIFKKFLNIYYLKKELRKSWFDLTTGYIGTLILNGLGFKSTRKKSDLLKKYWRFNVGHSHVFLYFTPKKNIMKVKNRNIFIFGFNKQQVYDILKKLKSFHIPDVYKGVGLKFPNEVIILKKGKTRQ